MKIILVVFYLLLSASTAGADIVYQDFEPDNGTPVQPSRGPNYGWGFNGTTAGVCGDEAYQHSGRQSWKVVIPQGKHLETGTGIASSIETFDMNFRPQEHDRLLFWILSEPDYEGDHTVFVKIFDRGRYRQAGFGIWTEETAQYKQWTRMHILFEQLPADLDLNHIDKIEFFNYWEGTYYYDDIILGSRARQVSDDPEDNRSQRALDAAYLRLNQSLRSGKDDLK